MRFDRQTPQEGRVVVSLAPYDLIAHQRLKRSERIADMIAIVAALAGGAYAYLHWFA
jgi:hypothetical protein